jgi:hypothetical protein
MYQLHAGLRRLTNETNATYGTNVQYGSVFFAAAEDATLTGFPDNSPLFHSVPDDMDFYGVDVYGHVGLPRGLCRLDTFIDQAKPKDTKNNYPKLLIAETNTPVSSTYPDAAPRTGGVGTGWYQSVCARMNIYGTNSIGVLTYWKDGGGFSGAWNYNEDIDGDFDYAVGPARSAHDPWVGPDVISALKDCIDNILPLIGQKYTLPTC